MKIEKLKNSDEGSDIPWNLCRGGLRPYCIKFFVLQYNI